MYLFQLKLAIYEKKGQLSIFRAILTLDSFTLWEAIMNYIDPAILGRVSKPARYTGKEWNSITKDHAQVDITFALAFPDVYEVAMSHQGLKILYHILNRRSDCAAERVFSPWVDMEAEMRAASIPLHTLESFRPVREFDVLGFTLQYELSYSNILNMLDLAGIPLLTKDRTEEHPFVIAGGPCAFNAEPIADFIDFFALGESEEAINEIADCLTQWKKAGKPGGRQGLLEQMAAMEGIYVPSFYDINYNPDGTIESISPNHPKAKSVIYKRLVKDLETLEYPTKPIVPYLDTVHDRAVIELFRGCTRGCRFCQAGMLYRPVRERKPETLLKIAQELIDNTGYSEISLTSLSSADYSHLQELVRALIAQFRGQGVSVSLPSLRIDSFSVELAQEVQQVRKSGLTFAPEAGSQRMRNIINKGVTEQNLEDAVRSAFQAGWSTVKLYFMIGLPGETDEDIKGIADLAYKVLDIYKQVKGKRGAKVTVSVSSFVPKSHTAFQWFGQNSVAEIERKQQYLRSLIRDRNITYNYHDARTSFMEGVFARGDRRLGAVLSHAWKAGAKYDGWTEHFRYDLWMEAFAVTGIDPAFYANRERGAEECLPWDHLDAAVHKNFLLEEYRRAIAEEPTIDCRRDLCSACGVCPGLTAEVIDWGGKR